MSKRGRPQKLSDDDKNNILNLHSYKQDREAELKDIIFEAERELKMLRFDYSQRQLALKFDVAIKTINNIIVMERSNDS